MGAIAPLHEGCWSRKQEISITYGNNHVRFPCIPTRLGALAKTIRYNLMVINPGTGVRKTWFVILS